jgi:hypothetical protein
MQEAYIKEFIAGALPRKDAVSRGPDSFDVAQEDVRREESFFDAKIAECRDGQLGEVLGAASSRLRCPCGSGA